MTTEEQRPQLVFSRLTDKPVVCYHPGSHSYPVYWKGLSMVRESALLVASTIWGVSNATPKMKAAAHSELRRALMLNAFGKVAWENSINPDPSGYHNYLVRNICPDVTVAEEMRRGADAREMLGWFMPSKAEVIED